MEDGVAADGGVAAEVGVRPDRSGRRVRPYRNAALLLGAAHAMIGPSGWMARAFARVDGLLRLELGHEFDVLWGRGADLSASESVELLIDITTRALGP